MRICLKKKQAESPDSVAAGTGQCSVVESREPPPIEEGVILVTHNVRCMCKWVTGKPRYFDFEPDVGIVDESDDSGHCIGLGL